MSRPPARWSTAASLAWWKKLLIVGVIVALYLLAISLMQDGGGCGGPMSTHC
ncbi:MAG: hypothetical protein QOJ31_1620 [Gaiellales bacterium]|jgi:hypothetical protein|nr:hypothetical protein [Gaiellales bacterium]MDX6544989.1 hypothetical protein [Gaiellales bacterium]MDX6550936.1 hypothetical protein [Gaiellales bacterium]